MDPLLIHIYIYIYLGMLGHCFGHLWRSITYSKTLAAGKGLCSFQIRIALVSFTAFAVNVNIYTLGLAFFHLLFFDWALVQATHCSAT